MKTIKRDALETDVQSSDDLDPFVGVIDDHLLVSSRPSVSDTFTAAAGSLPTIPAKWFRITNNSGSAVTVTKRRPLLTKYFDGTSLGVLKDSGSIILTNPTTSTPNGDSRVLRINHTDDNSAYAVIPAPYGLQVGHTLTCYFKVESNTTELQPLGIYTSYGAIDNNFPAVGLRVNSDDTFGIRVGSVGTVYGSAHNPGSWYKVNISIPSSTSASVAVYEFAGGTWVEAVNEVVTSDGYGLLGGADGVLAQQDYVVAFAGEGPGVQYIDNFEILSQQATGETLLDGTTKEYDCRRSLDEYAVDGAVTGYYRG